ncbi:MAG: exodeoxyribonuclease VII large subunit [Bacteroidales bacterium]|nr:exodeoxyribonuclease VII large subunit [Bacteroidales bacterium]
MPEIINQKKVFSLFELSNSLSSVINRNYQSMYWIKAEISKLNYFKKSGNCYPELVHNLNGKAIASFSAFLQKREYDIINQKFIHTTGEPLKDGMVVLMYCSVHFSKLKGIRLNIHDIDIDNILGGQAKIILENINKLKSEGFFALNKQLYLPSLIKRLAIISVESGKGYADFIKLINTDLNLNFKIKLFNSAMIGSQAVSEIVNSLKLIYNQKQNFDAVCIIRGGGGEATLQCFNDYLLSKAIAKFPLPVFTGIGHATNLTIAEQVSNQNFVSPSDLAIFLINRLKNEVNKFNTLTENISLLLKRNLEYQNNNFSQKINSTKLMFLNPLKTKQLRLDNLNSNFSLSTKRLFYTENQKINSKKSNIVFRIKNMFLVLEQRLNTKASNILTKLNQNTKISLDNKTIKSVSELKSGDVIKVFINDGIVEAVVKNIIKS